ncbi:MAG: hypothetical protein RL088_1227 [Verrucomicrobiota bacterium]|jgi:hypothetical protein
MNAPKRDGTIFDWSGAHRSSWTLALFIFLSLFAHSAAFFFVHISAPERQLIPKTAQSIQLLTRFGADGAPSPENEAVLRWIAAEDPAVVARITSAEPAGLLDVPYRPSYAVFRTEPRDIPAEPVVIQYPPARDSLTYILDADRRPLPIVPEAPATATVIVFHGPFAARAGGEIRLKPDVTSSQPLRSVELLAGVNGGGEVRFCYVQSGSGSAEMDSEAVRMVSAVRLSPGAAEIAWGTVVVRWGSDSVTAGK